MADMTTQTEALKHLKAITEAFGPDAGIELDQKAWSKLHTAIKEVLAQPEQEPVAMKFMIYKPTVPDPTRQDINNALLPWVYDQDRSSGFDASMWVTPVATLPPQRKPLTDEQRHAIARQADENDWHDYDIIDAVEAAHGIKG